MQVKDKTVAYYYDEEVGNVNYGGGNPMRPHRVRLTHNLVENYGLNRKLLVQRPNRCSERELEEFHADGVSPRDRVVWQCQCHRHHHPKSQDSMPACPLAFLAFRVYLDHTSIVYTTKLRGVRIEGTSVTGRGFLVAKSPLGHAPLLGQGCSF